MAQVGRQTAQEKHAGPTSRLTLEQAPPSAGYDRDFSETYELGQPLGAGSFKTVFVGRHRCTGERVAVQVIAKDREGTTAADNVARIQKEVCTFARVPRAHLVQPCQPGRKGRDTMARCARAWGLLRSPCRLVAMVQMQASLPRSLLVQQLCQAVIRVELWAMLCVNLSAHSYVQVTITQLLQVTPETIRLHGVYEVSCCTLPHAALDCA